MRAGRRTGAASLSAATGYAFGPPAASSTTALMSPPAQKALSPVPRRIIVEIEGSFDHF